MIKALDLELITVVISVVADRALRLEETYGVR